MPSHYVICTDGLLARSQPPWLQLLLTFCFILLKLFYFQLSQDVQLWIFFYTYTVKTNTRMRKMKEMRKWIQRKIKDHGGPRCNLFFCLFVFFCQTWRGDTLKHEENISKLNCKSGKPYMYMMPRRYWKNRLNTRKIWRSGGEMVIKWLQKGTIGDILGSNVIACLRCCEVPAKGQSSRFRTAGRHAFVSSKVTCILVVSWSIYSEDALVWIMCLYGRFHCLQSAQPQEGMPLSAPKSLVYLLSPDPFTVKMPLSESITSTSDAMYLELLAFRSRQWSMVVHGRPCRYSGTKSL